MYHIVVSYPEGNIFELLCCHIKKEKTDESVKVVTV